jgi:hypothetical protein
VKEGALQKEIHSFEVPKHLQSATRLSQGVCLPPIYYSIDFGGFGGLEEEGRNIGELQPTGKCATQPGRVDPVIEGKEIDLVPFFMSLWCLWRLFSSSLSLLEQHHSSLIILLVSIQICRSIVSGSSYYLNKGQI